MPVFNGDDIARINKFAEDHGKEWQVIDNFGGGIRIKFKDNKFISEEIIFKGKIGTFEIKNNKINILKILRKIF